MRKSEMGEIGRTDRARYSAIRRVLGTELEDIDRDRVEFIEAFVSKGFSIIKLKGIKNITDQSIVEVVTFSFPLFLIFNVNIPPTA